MKPSDFAKVFPLDSPFKSMESETVAQSIMTILARTGDTFRMLPWEEYMAQRTRDGNFSREEKIYFEEVKTFCSSEDRAIAFSKAWASLLSTSVDFEAKPIDAHLEAMCASIANHLAPSSEPEPEIASATTLTMADLLTAQGDFGANGAARMEQEYDNGNPDWLDPENMAGDPIAAYLANSWIGADEGKDLNKIQMDIEYAIQQLNGALKLVKSIN